TAQAQRRNARCAGAGHTRGWTDAQGGRASCAFITALWGGGTPAHHSSPSSSVSEAAGKKTVTIAKADAIDVTRYTVQYELLRAQVIGAANDMVRTGDTVAPRGIGLALLFREGMPGWLRAMDAVMLQATESPDSHRQLPLEKSVQHTVAPASLWSAQL